MNYGTIFECDGKRAIRHRMPQAQWQTVCNIDVPIPEDWTLNSKWNIEPGDRKEIRCKKCYPNQRKVRKPWLTEKK